MKSRDRKRLPSFGSSDYKYIHNGTINIYILFVSGNHVIENDFRSSDRVNAIYIYMRAQRVNIGS